MAEAPRPGWGRRAGTKAEEEAAVEWGTGFPVTGPGHHLQ